MKIEIEITEAEISDTIGKKVHSLVAEYANGFFVDNAIKNMIKKHWDNTVENLVMEELGESDKIRAIIKASIEKKIKAQLSAIMSEKNQ